MRIGIHIIIDKPATMHVMVITEMSMAIPFESHI